MFPDGEYFSLHRRHTLAVAVGVAVAVVSSSILFSPDFPLSVFFFFFPTDFCFLDLLLLGLFSMWAVLWAMISSVWHLLLKESSV